MDKSVKILRVESVLRELVPEAISSLSDPQINTIPVLDVKCSRGKYDAEVYLDPSFTDLVDEKYIVKHLSQASSYIENYCKQAEGWYRCPKFKFKFDHSLEKQNSIDAVFKKIEKELHKNDG
ncbi:MAG TPA: 30S ribosome-binding factor RbfA [Campylobacterales bacterium]|nr:30S ribosome-binding factor RbfA [Campylobacterales bacterium]